MGSPSPPRPVFPGIRPRRYPASGLCDKRVPNPRDLFLAPPDGPPSRGPGHALRALARNHLLRRLAWGRHPVCPLYRRGPLL
ncbi:MAG: hypothetical protein BRD55_04540 [Bacteroidetes bacterium SW_9_63_38]|nr:MAG: hypothetical protein BRD55_04540 [Bacteroidetes bacterium SW_9_63_38]